MFLRKLLNFSLRLSGGVQGQVLSFNHFHLLTVLNWRIFIDITIFHAPLYIHLLEILFHIKSLNIWIWVQQDNDSDLFHLQRQVELNLLFDPASCDGDCVHVGHLCLVQHGYVQGELVQILRQHLHNCKDNSNK